MTNICDLHPEILSMIFENAKNLTDEVPPTYDTNGGRNHDTAFEVTALKTCAYFREVALTTPRLWTSIHVHAASHLRNIVAMLARSGDCWLDIRIDQAVQDLQMHIVKLDPIIDTLVLHSLRWRSLCIGYSCERQNHPVVMQLCSASAPGLQQLSITVNDVAGVDGTLVNRPVELPHIFRDGVPRLGFIRLRGFAVQLFRPPLNAVVTLHLEQISSLCILYSTLINILTCSPYLAYLSMYGDIVAPWSWGTQQNTFSLPALRSLRVYSVSGEAIAGILKGIDAPNLESLTLKNLRDHDLDPLWNISDKEARFKALKTLNFLEFDLRASTCKHLFETFQHITTFSTAHTSAGIPESTIINILSEATVEDLNELQYVPWPELEVLCLGSDFYDCNRELINKLIAVRKTHGCPVSTFVFMMDAEDMEDVSPVEFEAGTEVEVKFCSAENCVWPENSTYIDHDDILF